MHPHLKTALLGTLALLAVACTNKTAMAQYKKMPRVRSLAQAKTNYGKTVKLFGVLVHQPLKNGKTIVQEDAFFFRLNDGQLVFLPTTGAMPATMERYNSLTGKKVFIVAPLMPPGPLAPYPNLQMPYMGVGGIVTDITNETLVKPQISSIAELDRFSERFAPADTFFAYISGKMAGNISEMTVFPMTLKIHLNDGAIIEAVVNEKADLDLLSQPGEKVFISGHINKTDGRYRVLDAGIADYTSYMDRYSKE